MRKFKNNRRANLVDSYRRGWQRAIHRYEEQYPSYILIVQRPRHLPIADRPAVCRVPVKL